MIDGTKAAAGRTTRTIALMGTMLLFLSGCDLLGPSLAPELIGQWSSSSSHYTQTFTFTASSISYSDRAYNTGGSSSWDRKVVEVDDAGKRSTDDYDYTWIWHISGTTLYLDKLDSGDTPSGVPSDWWPDNSYAKYYPTKD